MRIAILAPGSRGDVQPYVALGLGLARAGHAVRVVTNRDFAELVRGHGLELVQVDFAVEEAMRARSASRAIEGGGLLGSMREIARIARRATHLLFEASLTAAQDADLLLSGMGGMLVAASLVEKRPLPWVQAYNVPLTPTGAFPGALLPWLSLWPRPWWHRLSHRLSRQALWQTMRMAGNTARGEVLGLPPMPVLPPFERPPFSNGPLLYGLSPSLIPRPDDWPAHIHVTGFWFADEPADWTPPPALADFLARGPAPVYVGFGSMSSEDPEATTRLVLDAVARAGVRAVVHRGWAGLAESAVPAGVCVVGSVPHSWLLPRVALAVHHGGAGTTAAALRAGVPSVVVPFHGDQPFWGQVVHARGVAPAPLPRRRLAAAHLAATMAQALGDDAMRARAAELGVAVRSEDGVGRAVALIEEAASRGGSPGCEAP